MTLVAAALVPESVLLLPGGAGRADPLVEERRLADGALRRALGSGTSRVLLVGAGRPRRVAVGPGTAADPYGVDVTLGALGLPDEVLAPRSADGGRGVLHEPAAVVALALLRAAGHHGEVDVRLVDTPEDAARLGTEAEEAGDDVVLLLVGSLSARRGPDAPLAEDPRAGEVDERALLALGRLAEEDLVWLTSAQEVAGELAVSAHVPWHALAAAVRAGAPLVPSAPPVMTAPLGADLVVAGWSRAGRTVREGS